jgi:hypothetical protein
MNEEFERTWYEEIVARSRHYPGICLKTLMKTTEWPMSRPRSDVAPAKYNSR